MCRFLLVRSKDKIKPEKLLRDFAVMCQKSHAPDGDWQGDGWGIALRQRSGQASIKETKWEVYKSLKPIWEDTDKFQQFGETVIFVAHARSSGFPQQKGVIEYNQPYVSDNLCFVFNGMIRGVTLPIPLEGKIGAQKIFSLILQKMYEKEMGEVLQEVDKLIMSNAKKVEGMNIGVVFNDKFYVLCEYENNTEYFGVKYFQDESLSLICSEPIGEYDWKVMKKGEVLVI